MSQPNSGSALDLFERYCRTPEVFWPGASARQARKLHQRVLRVSRFLGGDRRASPASVWDLTGRRHGLRRRTVYLSNIGSSGSHWLEAMLVDGAGLLGAGEVYLPPKLRMAVADLPDYEAARFIDGLHLLHAVVDPTLDRMDSVVNSQHVARPQAFLDADPGALRVLLLRDPVEVCLSRTYRKDEYRQDVSPEADDLAYLDLNIKKVASFLAAARGEVYDLVIRYEQLCIDPVPAVAAICALTGTPFDPDSLHQTAAEQSADQVSGRGNEAQTNLFSGVPRSVPQKARDRVTKLLREEAEYFGYSA